MKTKLKFFCEDEYEAVKLSRLLSNDKDNSSFIDAVDAVIGNEIVIKLKDKSSHSVTMKDSENAERLKEVIEKIGSSIIYVNTIITSIERLELEVNAEMY